MRPALLPGAALLMAVSSLAVAQTTPVPAGQSAPVAGQAGPNLSTPGQNTPAMTSRSPASSKAAALNSTDNARAGRLADAGGMFTNVPAAAGLTSKLVGLSVYNSENTDVGTIKDIAFGADGVQAYIVAVGGFLGMGNHYVAVKPSAINIRYDAANDKWRASMNTSEDQLKAAPDFKYSSAG